MVCSPKVEQFRGRFPLAQGYIERGWRLGEGLICGSQCFVCVMRLSN